MDRWEIYKILRGGMGIVYVVYDHQWREPLAAKTFQDEAVARDATVADRFTQEALAWVNLDIHQNVVQARFVQKIEDRPFLFLEYVSGGDLSGWVGTPRLTEDLPQVLRFAIQFCDGMTHALSKGIKAHRDIKPANCLITRNGTLKVTDFGLAKTFDDWSAASPESSAQSRQEEELGWRALMNDQTADDRKMGVPNLSTVSVGLTRTGMGAGSPPYMAPEQFDDLKRVDVRADIYSFGVMLFQMLTGQLPFVARTPEEFERLHKRNSPPSLDARFSGLQQTLETCLAKRPADRFTDFGQARARLADIYENLTGQPAPEPLAGAALKAHQWTVKGVSLDNLGRPEEAIACHDRALELDPRYTTAWYNKGGALTSAGRFEEAALCYDRPLELDPRDHEAWSNKGVMLERMGRYEDGIACHDRALEINPLHENAWYSKGVSLGELGRWEEALPCYDRAIELNPRDDEALHNRGVALDKLGRGEEALACYDRAIEINSSHSLVWLNKGTSLMDAGQEEDALSCFDRALQLRPVKRSHEEAWYNKAKALGRLRRFEEAIVCYDRALEINPRYEDAWVNKGVEFDRLNRHEDALVCYDRALEINPRHDRTLFNKSATLAKLGRAQEAIDCCDSAIDLNPGYAAAWANKGTCLHELERYDEALVGFDRALELNPQLTGTWSNRGGTLYKMGRHEEALVAFDRALELDPLTAATWSNKATVLEDLDRIEDALSCYNRALETQSDYDEGWCGKGRLLARMGRLKEAIECYDHAIRINSRHAGAWYHKGMAFSAMGQEPMALVCIDRAIGIDPSEAAAWYNKGVLLSSQGRTEEALACYDRAAQANPRYENAWYNKADTLRELGRWEEALVCYDRVLELNPRDGQGWFNKATLLFNLQRYEEAMSCAEQAMQFGRADAEQVIALCREMRVESTAKEIDKMDEVSQEQGVEPRIDASAAEWVDKGVELAEANRLKEAIICFDRALALDPRLERAWACKGIAMSASGRPDDGLACYDRVLEINPRNETAWYDRGNLLRAMQRFEEALYSYDRAIELNPRYVYAWGNKGAVFSDMRKPEEAIACCDHVIEIEPNDAMAWFNKGAILFNIVKRYPEALACFEQAERLGNPEAAQAVTRCQLVLPPAPETVEVEADSAEEAIAQVVSRVPEGFYLLSVTWLSDGKPKVVQAIAETTMAAFEKAQSEVPGDAIVKERKEISPPQERQVRVAAFDEASARAEALRQGGKTAVIKNLHFVMPGSQGLLGIGKRPGQYEAEVFQPAAVEITYQQKAKISARIGGLAHLLEQLAQVGRKVPPDRSSASHFLGRARRRAREIGEQINETGGIKLMLAAHEAVRSRLGSGAARELEAAWDGIGEWMG